MPTHLFGFHVVETKKDVYFPVNPERVEVSAGPHFMSYNILELGEVQIPRGRKLNRVRWEGWVPGPDYCYGTRSRPDFLHIGNGVLNDVGDLVRELRFLYELGEKSTVQLSILNTVVESWPSYLGDFTFRYDDGYGSIRYTVEWVEARALMAQPQTLPRFIPDRTVIAPPQSLNPERPDITPTIPGSDQIPFAPSGDPNNPDRPDIPFTPTTTAGVQQTGALVFRGGLMVGVPGRTITAPALANLSDLSQRQAPAPVATYRTRGGETWLDVAYRVYADTTPANPIRRANPVYEALETLPPNVVLVMPAA